jgi:ADP-ribose pyrophosphatase
MINRAEYFSLVDAFPDVFRNLPDAGFKIILEETEIEKVEQSAAAQLRAEGKPSEWAEVGVAFKDQYTLILRDAVQHPDGSLGTYIRMISPIPGVVILPVWQQKVLLIRHFRHATRAWHLEIPRGFGSSMDTLRSAQRELAEEIDASNVSWESLGDTYPDTGATNSVVALFFAEVHSYGKPDTKEAISDIIPVPIEEFERMISESELTDGYLLAAYARAKAKRLI